MNRRRPSRRSFLKTSTALAGITQLTGFLPRTAAREPDAPLVAYVGAFSSPLRDNLPTPVGLPSGNGRGIHVFRVDRITGSLAAIGVVEMGTSPGCLALKVAGA